MLNLQIKHLSQIEQTLEVKDLDTAKVKDLQRSLVIFGYPVGDIDGLFGRKTANAWAEYKKDIYQGNPKLIGTGSVGLIERQLRTINDRTLLYIFCDRASTINSIRAECYAQGLKLPWQIAYVLATVQHETANSFQPVREGLQASDRWRRSNLRYYPYYGRGYVQITWEFNYRRYGDILGLDLVGQPDLVMHPCISLFILIHGFRTGAFTGHKISDYINGDRRDLYNARRVINYIDKAREIAVLASQYC